MRMEIGGTIKKKHMKPILLREIVLFGISIILVFFIIRGCHNKIDESKYIQKEMFDASQDSLHKSINSLGQEETKTRLLNGSVSELQKLSSSKDSSIQKLLKLVNKKTLGATVFSNSTSGTVSSGTISHSRDTLRVKGKDSLIYIYPEYTLKRDSSRWEVISATANKDSFLVKYKVFNEFGLVQEFEKQRVKGKLFKQNVAMAKITNLNPHTETRELKSFTLEQPKKKQGKSFLVGVGVGIIAVIATEIKLKSLK